jgi:hypothetical protein
VITIAIAPMVLSSTPLSDPAIPVSCSS